MPKRNRDQLPFRQIVRCLLLTTGGRLVAQTANGSSGPYVRFPGGGVDPGETVWQAAEREVLEETGVKIKAGGTRRAFMSAKYVWEPEFADSPTRRQRFLTFQGEETHVLFGVVSSVGKPTSSEGDGWTGPKTLSLKRVIAVLDDQTSHPNLVALTTTLKCAARALQMTAGRAD
jgi:8-oxo-dGTP pyrophosphatase MutT (NUDIX family)